MTSSVVGSEMCIRDRMYGISLAAGLHEQTYGLVLIKLFSIKGVMPIPSSVSYTHLTLPTICSV
eukprot:10541359-Prorocentrum_lima.AAC.1